MSGSPEFREPGGTAGLLRLAIEGPMTIYEAVERKGELLAALDAAARLEIDLSGVDEMDSAGLQLLVLAGREAGNAGKSLAVVMHSAATEEVFHRYGMRPDFGGFTPRAR